MGLYYYGARYYDPTLGRFIQPDSIVPEPGNPQSLNRYAYVNNNPLRYTDPSGYCIPGVNCPGDVSGIEHPPDPSGLRGEAYAAWLTHYILWQEQQRAETGGTLDIELGQQAAAFELSGFLMKDPELLGDILYQQVAAAAPQLIAQAAGAATDVLISGADWALRMVRQAWQQAKTFPRFRDLPPQPGLERHHLVEKRFADVLGVEPGDLPADYVTPQKHRGPGSITSELRQRLPYGEPYAEEQLPKIWEAHKIVYEKRGRFDWVEAIRPYFEALEVSK